MNLDEILENIDLDTIRQIEETEDLQFIKMKECWSFLLEKSILKEKLENLFLFVIIANALITYQLSWTWENWWQEYYQFLWQKLSSLEEIPSFDFVIFFYDELFDVCKYNRRLQKIKKQRIQKLKIFFETENTLMDYKLDMFSLNNVIAKTMSQSSSAKTIVFAVKMYWYAVRVILSEFYSYPMDIWVPVDSRLIKLYEKINNKKTTSSKQVADWFEEISRQLSIPPLHLDSLCWVRIWKQII